MTEEYQVDINGKTVHAVRKGGKFYHSTEKGRHDLERPLDTTLILDKDFIKSEIPQAPAAGYTGRGDNYSKVSLKWLKWMEHDMGKPLQSAISDEGEHVIRVWREGLSGGWI